MKTKILLLIGMLLFLTIPSYSQEEIEYSNIKNVIPPLPQSMIFDKYLNHEIEEYNGLPEITIPLYTIDLTGLSIPVYLSYHASGIKFRQYDGEVGAGWMLNIGGFRVTRRVFGKADEDYPLYDESQFDQIGRYGFFQANAYFGNILYHHYLEDYQSSIINSYNFGGRQDSGRDLFSFHLPTTSGQFVISDRSTDTFHVLGETLEKIDRNNGFVITDDKGNKFIMSGDADLVERSDLNNITAWPMVRLETSVGDTMSVSYVRQLKSQQRGFSSNSLMIREAATMYSGTVSFEDRSTYDIDVPQGDDHYEESLLNELNTKDMSISIVRNGPQPNLVTEIRVTSKSDGKLIRRVVLRYDAPEDENDGHYLLTSVICYDGTLYTGECYYMTYNDGPEYPCPDMWGYYMSSQKIGQRLNSFDDNLILHDAQRNLMMKTTSDSNVRIPISSWQYGGYQWWADREDAENVADWYSLKTITFPTGGVTSYEYEPHEFRAADGSLVKGGGIRVARIESYGEDTPDVVTDYAYGIGKANLEITWDSFRDELLFFTIEREFELKEDITRCNRQLTLMTECNIPEASEFKVQYDYIEKHVVTETDNGRSEALTKSYYQIPDTYEMGPVESHCFPRNEDIYYNRFNVQVKNYFPARRPVLLKREYYDADDENPVKTEEYTYELTDTMVFRGVKLYQQAFFNNYFEQTDSYLYNAPSCVYSYFDYLKYGIVSGAYRMTSKKVIGEIKESSETYTYDSNNQLVGVSCMLSENPLRTRDVSYVYSHSIPMLSERNILSEVVQETISDGDVEIERISKEYGSFRSGKLVLPKSLEVSRNGSSQPCFAESYETYDQFGNIVSAIGDDGVRTIYVWSYMGRYPVLEIRNADYQTVEAVVSSVFGCSIDVLSQMAYNSGSKDALTEKIKSVQTDPRLANAMVTGYTYIPLLGISSVTDPSGRTTHYEYKGNKLSCVYYMQNDTKCIIESYEYKYAND